MNLTESYYPNSYPMPMVPVGYQQNYQPSSVQYQPPQQQYLPYYPQQNIYNYYYDRNEHFYPQDSQYQYQSSSSDGGYTVYNLKNNAKMTPSVAGFHVYEPARKSNVMGQSAYVRPQAIETSVEEILRKNPHLWNLYQSGRFEIVQMFDSKEKKIILKERTNLPDTKYTVTKFKVPINNSASNQVGPQPEEDHILLVSFSNDHIEPCSQIQIDTTQYVYEDVINRNYARALTNPISY